MALLQALASTPPTLLIPLLLLTFLISLSLYRLHLHPLSTIPGPLLARLSPLWTYLHSYLGDEATLITALHTIYGPVVRVAPNEICIADGSCLAPIYSDKGGFAKAACYRNFDIDGFASLFSETRGVVRAPKAKSVVGLFSTGRLRRGEEVLRECAERLVERMEREKERARRGAGGGAVNVLDLGRSLALDAVTAYLLGKSYGGLEEEDGEASTRKEDRKDDFKEAGKHTLSASEFVDAFVGVGRFFYLPNWLFVLAELLSEKFYGTKATQDSMRKVDAFVASVVLPKAEQHHTSSSSSDDDDDTYPARMLRAGLSAPEVMAQCKDLMFAGTDSSGMNFSTLVFHLARNPLILSRLTSEIHAADPSADISSAPLPYLRACVRETLRLSMANPTRLPRVVPASGWTWYCASNQQSYFFPAGTLVSAQMHTLHLNPAVFSNPLSFDPDRWLQQDAEVWEKMNRNFIPFGLGGRQCIARNLAMMELLLVGRALVGRGVLEGARTVGDKVEVLEWFNSRVVGEEILLRWE